MKIKSSILLFAIASQLLFSCKEILELEPAQTLSNEVALSNDEGVQQVLIGAYDYFAVGSLFGGELMRNAELYAGEGEIIWTGTFVGPREIFQRAILTTNFDVEDCWDNAYATINTCNNVLSALSVVNENDRARVEGEARLIRGWLLFELTRYFGQQYNPGELNDQLGVPVILTPTASLADNSQVARNTVEDCYAQVIDDLTQAENLLPEKNGVYFNSAIAAAVLARVYLQQENYEGARDAADRVIQLDNYSLVADYADAFGQDDNTKEDVFAVQISPQDGSNSMNTYFSTALNGGRGDIQIEQDFIDLYAADDLRADLFYKSGGKWRSGKFNNEFGNLPVIRLAEMFLIRAECNHRLGTAVGAAPVDDYNETHTRAGLAAASSVTLDDILFERRLELSHEGFKVHDVKRLRGNVAGMAYDDPKMVFPIPERELQVNLLLEQNPGY